jgi:hypothetical protein
MRTKLCSNRQLLTSRRSILQTMSCGFGYMAFSALAGSNRASAAEAVSSKPYMNASATGKFGKAKHVIFLCMRGGPSHVDMFDYKPQLEKDDGKQAVKGNSTWMKSPWKFNQHGQSGLWFSELVPNTAKHADKLCMIHSMQTDVPAHPQAVVRLHTGSSQFVRPSLGAWALYGLGVENENLPGFISIAPNGPGGAQNYGSSFLPATYQGMRLGSDRQAASDTRVPNLASISGPKRQRAELDFVQKMNQKMLAEHVAAPEIEGVIQSYETAFRMQDRLPQILNFDSEDAKTKEMYGFGNRDTENFGSKCLLARKLVESGVRFVEVTFGNWDQHNNLDTDLPRNCTQIDQGIDGLLTDLEQRGMLDETLVVWTGEFGRTPYAQSSNGRDHNHLAFTLWMAGGGVKPGMSYGKSGDYGYEASENPVPIVDLHATMLALMGIDHTKLTYPYAGRDFRLTDTAGRAISDIIG